jgi:phospholipid-translocating ATPase
MPRRFLGNKLNNQKYSIISFIPVVLYNEFRFFFNLFFLLTALSQLIPILKIGICFPIIDLGFLVTYLGPLMFVLFITMLKEAFDDFKRFSRDKEMNNKKHEILMYSGAVKTISSMNLKVGHIVKVHQNERIPADLLLLYTTERSGSIFIRTDQLDGETDWKHRKAVSKT